MPTGDRYEWDPKSTYVKNPPYFVDMTVEPAAVAPIVKARVLAVLGDSITTDHISPAGSIKADSPAGRVPDRARRERRRFQLLRSAARQRRGDGAGHVRQYSPAQPAGPGDRGGLDPASSRRRADDNLRRLAEVSWPREFR